MAEAIMCSLFSSYGLEIYRDFRLPELPSVDPEILYKPAILSALLQVTVRWRMFQITYKCISWILIREKGLIALNPVELNYLVRSTYDPRMNMINSTLSTWTPKLMRSIRDDNESKFITSWADSDSQQLCLWVSSTITSSTWTSLFELPRREKARKELHS